MNRKPWLPTQAIAVWIEDHSHTLLDSSAASRSYEEQYKIAPGALVWMAGVDRQGHRLKKWLFWRWRLQKLIHSKDLASAEEAKKGFMSMIVCGRLLDYDVPGKAIFAERLQIAMTEEIRKRGKQSVSGNDIDTDVNWGSLSA